MPFKIEKTPEQIARELGAPPPPNTQAPKPGKPPRPPKKNKNKIGF